MGIIIFTDLDGSLLNHDDYSYVEALPALTRIKAAGIPLIITTSKTRREVTPLRQEIGITAPFIVENGGGVFFPRSDDFDISGSYEKDGYVVMELGMSYEKIRAAFRNINERFPARGLGDMSLMEITDRTGLSLAGAVAAKDREFTEPFVLDTDQESDELDKLVTLAHPSAGLWFAIDTGLAEHFLPELPAMRLEQDPVHRHKDVLTHTLAVLENIRPPAEQPADRPPFDFRRTRLAALFHDVGKPRTRGYQKGRGVTFHHHDAVGARMTRKRLEALRYSNDDVTAITELVALHLRFHTYSMGWTDSAVRRYVRDAGPYLRELNVLTRGDCTTRNEAKARQLAARMDDLEARIDELATREELAAIRPELNGGQVMEQLGVGPGPVVGAALAYLLEIRLEEGLLGEQAVRERLDDWWRTNHRG